MRSNLVSKLINNTSSALKHNNFHFLHKNGPSFEGFYFKTALVDGTTLVIICGFAKSKVKSHAFIQVSSQLSKTFYFEYPLSSLKTSKETFNFSVGKNTFTQQGIDIKEEDCEINLSFSNFELWNRSFFNPSIMGALTFVPFVECKHDIISPYLEVNGEAKLKSKTLKFQDNSGYIDKNWGTSFPKDYFWGHISSFKNPTVSVQFAKAKPKWLLWKIPVHIGFLRMNGEIHLFKSWKKGKIKLINVGQEQIHLQNNQYKIELKFDKGYPLNLRAPLNGKLDYTILERAGIATSVTIYKKTNKDEFEILLSETVNNATLEICK